MRKAGMSFCLFIALGFGIGCAQTNTSVSNTSSQIMKLSATSTGTNSLLASVPAESMIDGYRDFKFGMAVSEVVAVAKKTCMSFSEKIAPKRVIGSRCYETGNNSENLELWFWVAPGTTGQPVLVYVSNEAAPYSQNNLSALNKMVSSEYPVVSRMNEDKLKQVVNGQDLPVGNLYAGGQVALVVEWKMGPLKQLNIYIRYCAPGFVAQMHTPYRT
jgi:hypothetical protein